MGELQTLRKAVDRKVAEWRSKRDFAKTLAKDLQEAELAVTDSETAQGIAQTVAQQVQQEVHDQIAGVVSRCLSAVFDEPYEFNIVFERKRGRTEARLTFERDGLEIDPMTASGGGVVDVASFALRLSCLILNKPPLRRTLIMDEPFRFVSEEYRDRIRELLETLSVEMGVQFVMVTHVQQLKTGTVVEVG